MSTITTINGADTITSSRTVINQNFQNLNTDKIETSVLDTDTALTANSDSKVATQKAVKAYVDAGGNVNASETTRGIVEEATDAEVSAGTAVGATTAKLFITPAKLLTYLASVALIPPKSVNFTTAFENSGRFTSIVNSGTNTFNTTGLYMDTTITASRAAGVTIDVGGGSGNLFLSSPVFSAIFNLPTTSAISLDAYLGIGTVAKTGAGHTFTSSHCGFKVLAAAGVMSLYGTQANGSTETATSALTTFVAGDSMEVMLKINGTSSIDYYYRKNGAAWSSATNLTTNLPSAADYRLQVSVSNVGGTQQNILAVASVSYSR